LTGAGFHGQAAYFIRGHGKISQSLARTRAARIVDKNINASNFFNNFSNTFSYPDDVTSIHLQGQNALRWETILLYKFLAKRLQRLIKKISNKNRGPFLQIAPGDNTPNVTRTTSDDGNFAAQSSS